MKTVTVHTAKTHLSRLIARAEAGEEVVIASGKIPVVRLVPVKVGKPERRFGAYRGRARVSAAFFAPLSDADLRAWSL